MILPKIRGSVLCLCPKIKDEQTKNAIEKCVQYMTRSIIYESKIVNYDDEKKVIHWFYHRH